MSNEVAQHEKRKRSLTDEDVDAIAEALRDRVVKEFYNDLGKSVWSFVWKGLILTMMGIAAAAAARHA